MKTSSYLAAFSFLAIFLPVLLGATVSVARPDREKVLNRARELTRQNRLAEAEAMLEDLRTQAVQEDNQPFEAVVLTTLGPVYERQAKYQEAQSAYEQAIAMVTESEGENAPELIQPIGKLATLLYESGQYSRAESLLVRQIGMMNTTGKPDKQSGMALATLGKVYLTQHRYDLAEQAARDSLKVYDRIGEPEGLGAAFGYSILGAISTQHGEYSSAEDSLQRALSIMQKNLAPDDRLVSEGIANLGLLYVAAGTLEKAEPLLAEAHERLDATGLNSSFRRGFLFAYADAERRLGHKKMAKELIKEGLSLVAKGPENSLSRDIVDASRYRQ